MNSSLELMRHLCRTGLGWEDIAVYLLKRGDIRRSDFPAVRTFVLRVIPASVRKIAP